MIAAARRTDRSHYVDFAHVPPSQWKVHDRLENWARWCRGTSRFDTQRGSPMFALYRSTDAKTVERLYGSETPVPVDKMDAQAMHKAVVMLPDKHRRAIYWHYLHSRNPTAMARELGVGLEGLATLVINGRTMLVNRGM